MSPSSKAKAVAMRSFRVMPDELKGLIYVDPRMMFLGHLLSKIASYKYQIKRLGASNILDASMKAVGPDFSKDILGEMKRKFNREGLRLIHLHSYLQCLEARKAGALNKDAIFVEWGLGEDVLSALQFDGDSIPLAPDHKASLSSKQPVVKKASKAKVSSTL